MRQPSSWKKCKVFRLYQGRYSSTAGPVPPSTYWPFVRALSTPYQKVWSQSEGALKQGLGRQQLIKGVQMTFGKCPCVPSKNAFPMQWGQQQLAEAPPGEESCQQGTLRGKQCWHQQGVTPSHSKQLVCPPQAAATAALALACRPKAMTAFKQPREEHKNQMSWKWTWHW